MRISDWSSAVGSSDLTGVDKANSLAMAILERWQQLGRPCSQAVLDTALMYCRDRAAAWRPENAVLAHGDPPPANILELPDTDGNRQRVGVGTSVAGSVTPGGISNS